MDSLLLELPQNLENMKLPDPQLMLYYQNVEDRVISIETDIDESLLEFSKQIIRWNKLDRDIPIDQRKPIKIRIYSYGGDLDICYSFISLVKLSKTPVYTYNMGVAMSAALLILLSGSKRYTIPRATALIHSGSASVSGTAEQVAEHTKNYKRQLSEMKDFILENTKITTNLFSKKSKLDWFIADKEQVELGIVDEIVEDIDVLY